MREHQPGQHGRGVEAGQGADRQPHSLQLQHRTALRRRVQAASNNISAFGRQMSDIQSAGLVTDWLLYTEYTSKPLM